MAFIPSIHQSVHISIDQSTDPIINQSLLPCIHSLIHLPNLSIHDRPVNSDLQLFVKQIVQYIVTSKKKQLSMQSSIQSIPHFHQLQNRCHSILQMAPPYSHRLWWVVGAEVDVIRPTAVSVVGQALIGSYRQSCYYVRGLCQYLSTATHWHWLWWT